MGLSAQAYIDGVRSGEIVTGKLVRLAVERHVNDLERGAERGLRWDADAAELAVEFFGLLSHSKGRWAGQPFALEPWQAFVVASLFGWKRADGYRRFRTAYIQVARKNGKTTMLGGVGLYLLVADREAGAEVYSAATKRDQARIMHGEAVRMVKASPSLRARVRAYRDNLHVLATGSKYEPLGADADTMDGLNVHGALVDELHAHRHRDLWDRLETATGARSQPLMIGITTAGDDETGLCWELHEGARRVLEGLSEDDALFGYVAEPDEGDDWKDPTTWAKGNPNLGVSVTREDLEAQCNSAANRPASQNAFRRFRCNQWVRQRSRFIDLDAWTACAGDLEPAELVVRNEGRLGYGGLDLSARTDLTAFVLAFPGEDGDPIDVVAWHWIPEERVGVLEDVTQMPLRRWIDEGFLEATPGDVVDLEFIRQRILELAEAHSIAEIAFDRYGALWVYPQLQNDGLNMIAMGQGFVSMNPATAELEARVLARTVRHGGNPLLRWQADCLEVRTDPAGNVKPVKPDRKRASKRIDGMVALIMALDRATRREDPGPSVYEERGILSL